jgi:predicted amidophosphoribosyltransferase
VLDVLLPLSCPGCGRAPVRGTPLCASCLAGLVEPVLLRPPVGVDAWYAPFSYEGAARELVARIKYRNVRAAVPWVAARMVESASAAGIAQAVVTWAPSTPVRQRARGFDPARELALAVARRGRAPVARLLVRVSRLVAPRRARSCSSTTSRPPAPRWSPRRGPSVLQARLVWSPSTPPPGRE